MSNYTKTTNFATKDSLPSGNAAKIVRGTEIDTEFNNIATASATKADTASPTFHWYCYSRYRKRHRYIDG